ncbi:uncharacterized protein TRIADDRAFT_52708 [Trichoplax adhaerens]|uniref:G-protein coupled receptors family 1 profile domain-containing protein n=1 Tax=Trichoplax adhaerens TaxID=10228 RepID=B3RJX1_TRIAD|nr:hypothetical protein TRIADDRAFT_52708 [Trichoplax adhaerens]EDV29858.1 hypothetical protein TRIADDRAFT_52708 [Trichoplax adhaerens]|eukprot:XP_002109060.1 hypothetical protein TRIADDRAFT_52708 [Trichoplax adhaerens]
MLNNGSSAFIPTLAPSSMERNWGAFIVFCLCCVVLILGDILTLITMKMKAKKELLKHDIMVISLATNDIISCLLISPFVIGTFISPTGTFGNTDTCRMLGYFRTFTCGSSLCIVLLMSLERRLAILTPFYYRLNVTSKQVVISILVGMSICLAYAALPLVGVGQYGRSKPRGLCFLRLTNPIDSGSRAMTISLAVVVSLILLGILICNIQVLHSIFETLREAKTFKEKARQACPLCKLTIGVSIVSCVCYSPLIIYDVLLNFDVKMSVTVEIWIQNSIWIHMALNPIIYGAAREHLRHYFCHIMRVVCFGMCFKDFSNEISQEETSMLKRLQRKIESRGNLLGSARTSIAMMTPTLSTDKIDKVDEITEDTDVLKIEITPTQMACKL